jgi:hypothetical protein
VRIATGLDSRDQFLFRQQLDMLDQVIVNKNMAIGDVNKDMAIGDAPI